MNKLIIFDLDGVIFNSKSNMNKAWREVRNKLKLNISFNEYFNNIGIPFNKILKKLKIKKNLFLKISKIYKETSIKKKQLYKSLPRSKIYYKLFKKKKLQVSYFDIKRTIQNT